MQKKNIFYLVIFIIIYLSYQNYSVYLKFANNEQKINQLFNQLFRLNTENSILTKLKPDYFMPAYNMEGYLNLFKIIETEYPNYQSENLKEYNTVYGIKYSINIEVICKYDILKKIIYNIESDRINYKINKLNIYSLDNKKLNTKFNVEWFEYK